MFDTKDLFTDPHLHERNFIHHFPGKEGDNGISLLGWPARLSESKVPIELAPALGEDTFGVLQAELGLTTAKLNELQADGVLGENAVADE